MKKFIAFSLALVFMGSMAVPPVAFAHEGTHTTPSVEFNTWLQGVIENTIRVSLGSESLNEFLRITINEALRLPHPTIIVASSSVSVPPIVLPSASSTQPCVVPPNPSQGNAPFIYKDGKLKIVSTGDTFIYKNGKHKIVSTPGAYIEKNGKEKIVITPGASIYKNGSLKYVVPCDGTYGTTTPPVADTLAPVLSGVAASTTSLTSVNITWTTNEKATGRVYFGTTQPLVVGSATTQFNPFLETSHTFTLSGLTASTTYYYIVESIDKWGNKATSTQQSFTTGTVSVSDATAPLLSAISIGSVVGTSAQVNWATNELSTSKVYYGTTTPLALGSALVVSNASLVTGHVVPLSGLSTSTAYYVIIESKDAANNTAVSSELSFTTGL